MKNYGYSYSQALAAYFKDIKPNFVDGVNTNTTTRSTIFKEHTSFGEVISETFDGISGEKTSAEMKIPKLTAEEKELLKMPLALVGKAQKYNLSLINIQK